jgi:hypothetical protein
VEPELYHRLQISMGAKMETRSELVLGNISSG